METKRLIDIYDKQNNSFDDLRFIFATLVLYVHSYALLYGEGVLVDPFTKLANFQLGLGSLAVYGFFVLSGFFMIQSLESNKSLMVYAKNRIYRIIPAFWLSLGLASFVLVPIISDQASIFGFEDGTSLNFFIKAGAFHLFGYAWTINGAFPTNPLVDGINGSMWTLKHEIALYAILPLIVYLTYQKKNFLLGVFFLFIILAIANTVSGFILFNIPCCRGWVFASNEYPSLIVFTAYFFAGVILFKFRETIIVSNRILISFMILFLLSIFFGNLKIIILLVFPYLIIVLGSKIKLKMFSRTGDYSYGMYIYAFPVQQTIVHFFKNDLNVYSLFGFSFLTTLILSIFSWHFFEKKILSMKHKRKNLHV